MSFKVESYARYHQLRYFSFNTFINEKEGYKDETSMEDTKVTQQRIKTNLTKKRKGSTKKYALTIRDNPLQYKIGTDPL